ncbi:hypothetical protein GQ600_14423 [Phytophthora cactorum]|nr:hypothetical protein GQ600_14423 [Phytophthora cactorum]
MAPAKRPVYDQDAIFRGVPPPVPREEGADGKDKELAEAREVAQKRRRLARVAKENGHLTIPQSPKFRKIKKSAARSPQNAKIPRRHDHGAAPGKSDQFSKALSASGGVGVPAVRRPKLTTPVSFEFEIDKRAAAAETRKSLKRKSMAATEEEGADGNRSEGREENKPLHKQRRKSAAA